MWIRRLILYTFKLFYFYNYWCHGFDVKQQRHKCGSIECGHTYISNTNDIADRVYSSVEQEKQLNNVLDRIEVSCVCFFVESEHWV